MASATVVVNTGKSGGGVGTGLLLGLFILVILGLLAYAAYRFSAHWKRDKLLKWFNKKAAEKGLQVPEDYLKKNLKRLNVEDLDNLLKFTKAIDDKNYATMIGMIPIIHTIIFSKTDAGLVGGLLGIKKVDE